MTGAYLIGAWRCPTLTWAKPTLPSALLCFTSEFGMGSGGSTMLWSPSKFCLSFVRYAALLCGQSFGHMVNHAPLSPALSALPIKQNPAQNTNQLILLFCAVF